ncbi:MAG: M20/M25/M40 family metallo-hydrolase, partial [Acidobacteria bacterium]|nr:M20/M25/M40 family metallo-hydrolase [Acidobacteriota bacterium]
VAELIDREKVIRWALEAASFYSPTGHEGAVAKYLYEECRKLGLQAKLQPVAKGRDNVIGRLEGSGGGYELMFNGHLDTFRTGRPGGRYTFGSTKSLYQDESEEPPPPKVIDDQWLFGHEIANMKSAIAAYLGAVDAIIRSGIQLKGGVVIAGVVGTDPTSSWTDGNPVPLDEELGIGTRYMLNHGVTADMCVLGEPTSLAVVPNGLGRVRVKLTVSSGDGTYIAPIEKMNRVLAAFEEWVPTYQKAHKYKTVLPGVSVAAIQCRNDFPGNCNVYLEFRTIPGQHPLDVVNEVRGVASRLQAEDAKLNILTETLLTEPATEIDIDAPVVRALRRAHELVVQVPPEITYVEYSGDSVRLNQAGVPTVIYGPAAWGPGGKVYKGASKGHSMDYQNVKDLVTAAQVYAVVAADICSRDRS